MMTMNRTEIVILEYLESRDDGWEWSNGTKVFGKHETIRLFTKDDKFRKMIVDQVTKLSVDLFIRGKGR